MLFCEIRADSGVIVDDRDLVFISCGQFTDAEKRLGKAVCGLVEDVTPYKPYFAEQVTSLKALTDNILCALDRAVGLIAIMHPRGTVTTPTGTVIRASVWIEQEIAIFAHLVLVHGKEINVQAYAHKDICLEGIRTNLLLNPYLFSHDDEILSHLRTKLPDWAP